MRTSSRIEGKSMRELTYHGAIREAVREEIRRDDRVFIMGEDEARGGGALNRGMRPVAERRSGLWLFDSLGYG